MRSDQKAAGRGQKSSRGGDRLATEPLARPPRRGELKAWTSSRRQGRGGFALKTRARRVPAALRLSLGRRRRGLSESMIKRHAELTNYNLGLVTARRGCAYLLPRMPYAKTASQSGCFSQTQRDTAVHNTFARDTSRQPYFPVAPL